MQGLMQKKLVNAFAVCIILALGKEGAFAVCNFLSIVGKEGVFAVCNFLSTLGKGMCHVVTPFHPGPSSYFSLPSTHV